MTAPVLDIVIVNWNTKALCQALLATLHPIVERHGGWRVILVDNGSTDGSADLIGREFTWVTLIRSDENLGYARGNNLGLDHAQAPYVWLLNSDTEVQDPAMPARLLSFLQEHPDCGAVGPALVLTDGTLQTGAAGHDIGLDTAFQYYFFLSRVFPGLCRGYFLDQAFWSKTQEAVEVGWVSGAGIMLSRAALEKAGRVPTDHFMYAEDVKLCRLLRGHGYKVFYLPTATLTHHHGASSGKTGVVSTRWIQSVLDEYGSRVGPVRRVAMKAIFTTGFFLRAFLYLVLGGLGRRRRTLAKSSAMMAYGAAALRHRYRAEHPA